ncbi:MAG TPA: efflux RND transporter periplasmic adaptor subunit [Rhodanobacter sp.]|jgi:membrane fusion protein (multidrug efflux system)|nr:efflux RND transporter periplasmic adaptor subunit [Rhodanobacter sp.]
MKLSLLRATLLGLGLLALAACGEKTQNAAPQQSTPEVEVLQVQAQDAPLTQAVVGRLSPYRSADVRARVAGVLLQRVYDEGSMVKKGQLLFRIDPAPLQATLAASTAALAQAEATYTNAKVTAERSRNLAPKGYVSKADLDNALAAERTAAAAMQAAKANVQSARINLGYANVTAPIAGRAGQQQVTEGALVGSGSATLLTTVDQIDQLYVNFTMSVTDLERMRRAQGNGNVTLAPTAKTSVAITLPDGSAYPESGVLDFSDTSVNPATGAVNLRALVPNPQLRLLPGMYVTMEVRLGEQHGVFVVPQQAVQRDTVGAYMFVVDQAGKVARKDVTTGTMQDGDWIITQGLAAGDRVVMSGVQNIRVGQEVKTTPWRAAATTSASAGSAPGAAGGR